MALLLPAEEVVFRVPLGTADEHMTPGAVGVAGCIVFSREALAADPPACLQGISRAAHQPAVSIWSGTVFIPVIR